ncbi:MAG: hypothetical protein HYR76_07055 [Ignavibacteria bacterium]|nr:hypothetical protein [Ignavibacteria bacterium]MBI3766384.1 hypothetical protein [Ignavibacteriales bacterium]
MQVRFFGLWITLSIVLSSTSSFAQDHPYDLAVFGTFTTSSKLFHHPNDADELLRSAFLPLNNVFSAGIDLRRSFEALRIQIGISIEYLKKTETSYVPDSSSTLIPVKDGFTAIPIELSGYFIIPVGTDDLHLYMGGGGGMYIGSRQYEYAGTSAAIIGRKVGYGIHILSGLQYALHPRVSLRSELKFRQIQFENMNKFVEDTALYNGVAVALDPEPFSSRIDIDGMTLSLGLVFHF